MEPETADLLRAYGASTRIVAAGGHHEVGSEWWVALSGASNVDMNSACCWSSSSEDLTQRCLKPLLDLGKPGFIMLAGPGLSGAQALADIGWVSVGAKPMMMIASPTWSRPRAVDVRRLGLGDLPPARVIVASAFNLDESGAALTLPDAAVEANGVGVWGLFVDGDLVATVTIVTEEELAVVWSMATLPTLQGRGHGRQLLECVLGEQFGNGIAGSLLISSRAGQRLYRELGYRDVTYLQYWSRPRWALGSS
jgi:GNAT superfamily N-acetyltransferase